VKRFLITIALAGAASAPAARAQDAAPAIDSSTLTPPSAKKWEVRVGGFLVSGERNSAFNNTARTGTGSVKGVDFLLRASGIGLQGRSSAGTFETQPDVVNADVSIILGPPSFSVFAGGAKRALSSTLGTQVYTFGRVGLQMTFLIGATGLRGQIGGWGYMPVSDSAERMNIGGEGEASILWSPPKIPIFFQLGYRNEVFTSKSATTTAPEEVRGLRIGAGLQLGGK
jgi:hypothetical protein